MNISMEKISKSFGSNLVLDGVDFNIKGGEICALLGENGAGKSTLMNILGGVLSPDGGTIRIDGEEKRFLTPSDSLKEGIAFIHQELNLINDLAIYENLFIGMEKKKKSGFLDKQAMIKATEDVFKRIDLTLDPCTMVRDLDASYKQIVEISRALMMDARIVIMDEPTTSLTEPEIERVFSLMSSLRNQGVGIIFISHKLKEVMTICDCCTVLRDGHMVATMAIKDTDVHQIAEAMVGHTIHQSEREENTFGDEIFRAEKLSDGRFFKDISFAVRKGEVLGFTGLLGDGRSELFEAVIGERHLHEGKLFLDKKEIHIHSTQKAVEHGIAYVPRNRKENGIIKDMSILENGSLVTLDKRRKHRFFLNSEAIMQDFASQKEKLRIKMGDESDLITSLSGGNQQKVVLAKWLSLNPRVLILDNPTQGVDVGAKEEIYDIILHLAKEGVAVIVLSSEAQEIMRVSDRAFVMYHGSIVGEVDRSEMNENKIMKLATGASIEER